MTCRANNEFTDAILFSQSETMGKCDISCRGSVVENGFSEQAAPSLNPTAGKLRQEGHTA